MSEISNSVVVESLVKRFGDFVAVDRINLAVRKGEVFGFLGPNGAGKSTTIRMLCGLLKPTSGRAEVAGFDVSRKPEAVRQNIGYMSQKFSLYNDLKVIENIRLFAGLYSVPSNELGARIEWALSMANLKGQENLITGTLPGGWKQRLALGCAVLHRPPVIFLDEPTSGVDPITRRQFWDLIHHPKVILLDEPTTGVDPVSRRDFWRILYELLAEGVAILTSTAYLDEAERCNRVALLHQGKLLFCDTPANLKAGMRKGVLSITSQDPRTLRSQLEHAQGISSLVLTGDGLHVVVDDAARRIPEFEALLKHAQVPFDAIQQVAPSIEDLFVDAVGNGGAIRA